MSRVTTQIKNEASGLRLGQIFSGTIMGALPPSFLVRVTSVTTTTTVFQCEVLENLGSPLGSVTLDDLFNNEFSVMGVQCTQSGNEGKVRDISDFTSATGELTTDAMPATYTIGDLLLIGLTSTMPYGVGTKGVLEVIETTPTGFPDYTSGQAAGGLICTADGDVVIDNILWSVKTASLGGVTNAALSTNNADNGGRKNEPVWTDVIASFAQYIQYSIIGGGGTHSFPITLESTKGLYIHGGTGDAATAFTGGATVTFTILYTRKTAGASLSSVLA